jgi:predicted phosphodiesterase
MGNNTSVDEDDFVLPSEPGFGSYKVERNNRKLIVYDPSMDLPEKAPNAVRFVCISDTHSLHSKIKNIPAGDVLIHAGDFSNVGEDKDIIALSEFLGKASFKHKVVIAGNHDLSFEDGYLDKRGQRKMNPNREYGPEPKKLLKNCIYLEDQETTIEGIRIYGSPWQPEFCDWAFNVERGPPIREKWDKIPLDGIDVLITHGPAQGFGGLCKNGIDAGCEELIKVIRKAKPLVHVFGHIHESYGVYEDKETLFINASTCTYSYMPTNRPIVFDVESVDKN